ncbi:50S ribosomal protein L10 [Chloroflexota bacterium]
MAISREKKREIVADYAERLSASQAVVLTEYRGLTVSDITDLRGKLREVDSGYQVVKNTLFRLALDEAGLPLPEEQLEGPIAVGYCYEEVPPAAKVLTEFAKQFGAVRIRGAILGQELLDADGVKALAALPPREVLLAQMLGAVQGPAGSIVNTVLAPMRELVQVLKARGEQEQELAA